MVVLNDVKWSWRGSGGQLGFIFGGFLMVPVVGVLVDAKVDDKQLYLLQSGGIWSFLMLEATERFV